MGQSQARQQQEEEATFSQQATEFQQQKQQKSQRVVVSDSDDDNDMVEGKKTKSAMLRSKMPPPSTQPAKKQQENEQQQQQQLKPTGVSPFPPMQMQQMASRMHPPQGNEGELGELHHPEPHHDDDMDGIPQKRKMMGSKKTAATTTVASKVSKKSATSHREDHDDVDSRKALQKMKMDVRNKHAILGDEGKRKFAGGGEYNEADTRASNIHPSRPSQRSSSLSKVAEAPPPAKPRMLPTAEAPAKKKKKKAAHDEEDDALPAPPQPRMKASMGMMPPLMKKMDDEGKVTKVEKGAVEYSEDESDDGEIPNDMEDLERLMMNVGEEQAAEVEEEFQQQQVKMPMMQQQEQPQPQRRRRRSLSRGRSTSNASEESEMSSSLARGSESDEDDELLMAKMGKEGKKKEGRGGQGGVSARAVTILRNKVLGRGGFGTVFQGFDNIRGMHVAVKEAHVGSTKPEITDELYTEFKLLTSLQHPNIVSVHDFSIRDGVAQIVMEWMSGGSVQSIIDATSFRFHEAAIRRYARETLEGLRYLHDDAGILHRDIKPGNILISGDGRVKLSDFGTSKVEGTASTTQHVVGTCAYMSPDAIQGRYSFGSDVWAWACALVEMAQGAPPWSHLPRERRENIQLMFFIGTAAQGQHHPPIPAHLSPALRAILERCFAYDPKDRPTAAQLLAEAYFSSKQSSASHLPQAAAAAVHVDHIEGAESLDSFQKELSGMGSRSDTSGTGSYIEQAAGGTSSSSSATTWLSSLTM